MKNSIKNLLIFSIVLFMTSGALTLLGALAKLQHWSWAGPLLIVGMVLNACSYLVGGISLIKYLRTK
jgi:1,4-dihydroxy-2-naphthoate octaprenyltransferase